MVPIPPSLCRGLKGGGNQGWNLVHTHSADIYRHQRRVSDILPPLKGVGFQHGTCEVNCSFSHRNARKCPIGRHFGGKIGFQKGVQPR